MRSSSEILADVAAGETALETLFDELEVAVLTAPELPAAVYDRVVELLRTDPFVRRQESWRLVRFVSNNWELLSDTQRLGLRDELVSAFDRFADWMGAFVISEILGERYVDATTLRQFDQLAKTSALSVRPLVAHGLRVLAQTTKEADIRTGAIHRLRELAATGEETVRSEAAEELKGLE